MTSVSTDAVHNYSEATKTACLYIGVALLWLVVVVASTVPGSVWRVCGKGIAIVAFSYTAWVIGKETLVLAKNKRARKSSLVTRNIVFSCVLGLVLGALVAATVA